MLSTHFTIAEMIHSRTATMKGITNDPPLSVMSILRDFCEIILEPIRQRFGPVAITSGYRSPELNASVGGVEHSDHIWTSERIAVDFRTPQHPLGVVFDWLRLQSNLPFDQVILERGKVPDSELDDCIHISYRINPRRMALAGETNNRSGYEKMQVVVA